MTPRLVEVVDVFSRVRHHSSGVTIRLDDCHVEHWGLSFRCATVDHQPQTHEITWLLPEYGLRLRRYESHRRHARGEPTLITAVWIEHDARSWTTTDLLLSLEVPVSGATRLLRSDDFGAAIASGLIRCSEADYALRTVHRVLDEIGRHRDIRHWLSYMGITEAW